MKFYNINRVYREQASDEGNDLPNNAPPAEAPPAEPAPDATPEDDGNLDTIPEEASLWDDLNKQLDQPEDDILPDEDSPQETPLEPPATPEETPPETPATPEETPPAETPATPEEPSAADTAVPTETPVVPEVQPTDTPADTTPQPTEAERAQAYADRKAGIEKHLEERLSITEAEALQLVTDPQKVFPKLQAKVFTEMWLAVEEMMQRNLPTAIENTTRELKVRDEKVDAFFEAWPKLDRKLHGAQVAQVASVYSQVNKNATEADVIKYVGMQVMMLNGIAPELTTPQTPDGTVTPPETPVTPHRPAAVNGSPAAPQQSSGNLYTDMSIELDEDED
jgi:hypothetical protein